MQLADKAAILSRVKSRIVNYDSSLDNVLEDYVDIAMEEIQTYIGLDGLPNSLAWVAVEIAVAKNVKRGNEGTTQSEEEGLTRYFNEADLTPFTATLDRWLDNQTKARGNTRYGSIRGFN